jgi:hypothetical protein
MKKDKRGSGKQILLRILEDLSTKLISDDDKSLANDQLKAGLLLRSGTSPSSHEAVELLQWGNSTDENGRIWRQGISTLQGNVFLSDILEDIVDNEDVKAFVLNKYKELDSETYEACTYAMWHILSSVQMFNETLSVETKHEIDIDRWVNLLNKQRKHFREEVN